MNSAIEKSDVVATEQILGVPRTNQERRGGQAGKTYHLAIVASHPIQYQSPLFRRLAASPAIDLKVYFCCDHGVNISKDKQFGTSFKWDIPLLEGFDYEFLKNWSPRPRPTPLGLFNPGVLSVLARGGYDAVLVTGWMTVTNWLVILGSTPVLLLADHPLKQELGKPLWKRVVRRPLLRALLRRFAGITYVGSDNKDFYLSRGVPEAKLFFCPLAVDNERFEQDYRTLKGRRAELRGELGIAPEHVAILFCGKLTNDKGLDTLLDGYLALTTVEVSLFIVGDGHLKGLIQERIRRYKLKNVHLVGFKNQTELPHYYTAADIFVLPSVSETWGLVVNEAMCFGLPVVVSDVPGAGRDLVRHGENGFVFSVGDVQQLAEYLRLLVTDEFLRRSMGQRSRQIISTWSYDEDVKGICAALAAVSARRAGRRITDVVRAQE